MCACVRTAPYMDLQDVSVVWEQLGNTRLLTQSPKSEHWLFAALPSRNMVEPLAALVACVFLIQLSWRLPVPNPTRL